MPELPEVEITRRGIAPHCENRTITQVTVRESRLRWPVPGNIAELLEGAVIHTVDRRAKYLLIRVSSATAAGSLIVHLGMSGSLRVITDQSDPLPHDHVELELDNGIFLRFNDPRRFGCWLWSETPDRHPLIAGLGPEPLAPDFTGRYLYRLSRGRKMPVKSFIMDSRVVAGVGNIYANEALFRASIHPRRAAGRIGLNRYNRLVQTIRETLGEAILMGGTTLRNFVNSDGKPGYFAQSLLVYGRGGEPCKECGHTLKEIRMNQRSTVYCSKCQR